MGVVNLLSTYLTNRDATPAVHTNANISGGSLVESMAVISAGTADSSTSTYRFVQIPSNARISQVLIWNTTFGGSCAADFGFYDTTANGSAIIGDGDEIAAAVNIHQTNTALDITHQGAEDLTIAHGEYMVWQVLGLSSDPGKMYDLCATLTANASSGTALKLAVRYVV